MRKRILSWVLALVMCLTLLPASALAEGDGQTPGASQVEEYTLELEAVELRYAGQQLSPEGYQTAYKALVAGIEDADASISMNAYSIPEAEMQSIIQAVISDYPEFFWFSGSGSYTVSNGMIQNFSPAYNTHAGNLAEERASVEAAAQTLLAGLPRSSDYETALEIHDRLAAHVEYVANTDDQNIYGALVGKKAVCAGYARAYQYLLNQAGIDAWYVTGSSVNPGTGAPESHAWTAVHLKTPVDAWYYVDVTWDDQGDTLFHAYFLRSYAGITEDHTFDSDIGASLPTTGTDDNYYFQKAGNGTVIDPANITADAIVKGLATDTDGITYSGHFYVTGKNTPQTAISAFSQGVSENLVGILEQLNMQGCGTALSSLGREAILTVSPMYSVALAESTGGSITASIPGGAFQGAAVYGSTVTLTAVPEAGYELVPDSLTVSGTAGQGNVAISGNGTTENSYTFTMPAYAVTVTAAFQEEQGGSQEPPAEGDLTRAELAQMLYNKFTPGYTLTGSASFNDIGDCTPDQQKAILALAELDYLNGTGENQFSPTGPVNAAGAATAMARIITGNSSATSDALVTLGILTSSEVADTTMQDATLEEWLARFVTRAELAEQLNSETYSWLHNSIHLMTPSLSVQFDDLNVCTADQETAIETLAANQILSGTSQDTFNPTGVVTRAQAAVVLWRAAGSRSNVNAVSLLDTYTDLVKTPWYQPAFNCLYAMGVLTGDDATNREFGLDTVVSVSDLTSWLGRCNTALGSADLNTNTRVGGITRAEMAEKVYNDYKTLLADKLFGITEPRGSASFTDISGCTAEQKEAIDFFYRRGFIDGTDESTFTPYAAASSGQIAVFLHRCATAVNSGSGTATVTETAGDGTLQASLLHDSGEWYAAAVEFLITNGRIILNGSEVKSVNEFTNPDAPGIGEEMVSWNDSLKPIRPTISCTNGTVTISGQEGETVYYTTDGTEPTTASTKYEGQFTVSSETAVKAVAVRNNMVSAVVSETCEPAPSDLTVELSETSFTYSGSSQKPATITVKLGDTALTTNDYTVSYTNSNGGKDNTTNAGTVTVTVTGTGTHAGKTGTAIYTIKKAALTIKAQDQTITYGESIAQAAAWYTATGLQGSDALTNITLAASTTNVTTTGTITPSDAYIKNGDTDVTANYDITYVDGKLIIRKANPTITFRDNYNPRKTYDGAPLAVPTADQLIITGGSYDDVTFTWYKDSVSEGNKLTSAPKDAGTYYVVASIAETANTTAATATSDLITISKRAITVTPDSGQSKVYGATEPTLTYQITEGSLVNGETLTGALSRVEGENVGSYAINQGTLSASGNYTLTFTPDVTFAITKAPQAALTITDKPTSVTYGDTFILTATGGSGDGAVTWAVPAGTAASVVSDTGAVTISGVGEVTITATKAGDGNYEDASASWTFTVQKKPVTATVAAADKTYDGNPTATVTATVAETDLVGNDSITITGLTGTFADANVGEDKTVTVNASNAQVTGINFECYEITYPATTTATISKDTSATAPAEGEGYTLDYAAETITVTSGYEVSTEDDGTGTAVPSGSISAYLGQALYIRKVEDANHTASGWTAFTLAARPGAPVAAIAQTNETVLGKGDGTVTGITAAMEYQINGGVWTDGPEDLTGLAAGTVVTVRVKATSSAPHGEETTRTIAAGPAITVTFDSQGGSSVDEVTDLSYGSKVTEPADPTLENYEFLGWYKEAAGTTPWDFGTDTVTADTTLYAKWKQVKFSVSVEVQDHTGTNPVSEATVILARGNETIGTGKTDTDGKFTFGRYIPAGAYNIVTAYTPSGGEEQTKTSLVVITNENAMVSVTMPSPGVNSVLTVAGNDTPAVVVGGLDEEAETLKTDEVTKVTVSMKVEEQSAAQADGANQIQQTANGQVLQFLDIRVQATVEAGGDTGVTPINKTTTVLEIVVPFDFEGKTDVTVYRYHDGAAGTLAEVDTKADGTYQLDTVNGLIHIFASKFSIYAIGYTTDDEEPVTPPITPVDPVIPSTPSTGGSEPDGDYAVTVDRTTGGKVTVNPGRADKGDTVTITATPDAGYVVDEVTVNGVTNGVKYLGDNKYSFTMPGSSAKISVTFVKDGTQAGFPFTDVSESFWARTEIQWAYENGYVNGTSATGFNPNGTISRQQVWMILARIAGENPASMAEAKAWAIANGVSDGSAPGGSVTRQQLVTILYRFAGQNGYDTTARADLSGYPDVATVESYATEAMAWAVAEGIIGGTTQGTLNPAGTASRAQFAVILYRYMA